MSVVEGCPLSGVPLYHHFIGYQNYIRLHMGRGLLQHLVDVLLNNYPNYLLHACLAKITCHFKEYCTSMYNKTGVNCFWIIDNSQQVLNRLHEINYFSLQQVTLIVMIFPHYILVFRMIPLNRHLSLSFKKHTRLEITAFL